MKSTTILALILGFQFVVVHAVATKLSLYWEIAWFDNLMHLFGGVLLIFILHTFVDIRALSKLWTRSFARVTFFCATALLGWEVFGVLMVGRFKEGFIEDTLFDLLFGILGCIAGWFISRALKKLEI